MMGGNLEAVTCSHFQSQTYAHASNIAFPNAYTSPVPCTCSTLHEGNLLAALNAPRSPRQVVLCDPPDPPGMCVCRNAATKIDPTS